jgi:FlaG/FlaF family flagellin (archaellin)
LIACSLLSRNLRKLIVNPKGFSSVIGTIFMVHVALVLSASVFLWTLSQNTAYFEAMREENQLELETA